MRYYVFKQEDQEAVSFTVTPDETGKPHGPGETPELLYFIDALTWEEAMAIYHIRQGWEPYDPKTEAVACPVDGAMFYAEGSGQCWKCELKKTLG